MSDSLLPNETLQSQVSAFVDDELSPAETDLFVRRLVKDSELKQTLGRYQLMGEALRAPSAARPRRTSQVSRSFSARVAAALENDAASAPIAAPAVKIGNQPRWLKSVGGVAIAASVALVAVLAVRNQPVVAPTTTAAVETLKPVVLTAQRLDSYVVPSVANAPTAPLPATRLTNYVVAHSEFSSPLGRRNVMTGLMAGEQPVPETMSETTIEETQTAAP